MNGRYALAESPEERLAIAVVSAIHSYFRQYPNGVQPGHSYLADFLKPFIEIELNDARLDELHKRGHAAAPRERELVELGKTLRDLCAQRI